MVKIKLGKLIALIGGATLAIAGVNYYGGSTRVEENVPYRGDSALSDDSRSMLVLDDQAKEERGNEEPRVRAIGDPDNFVYDGQSPVSYDVAVRSPRWIGDDRIIDYRLSSQSQ